MGQATEESFFEIGIAIGELSGQLRLLFTQCLFLIGCFVGALPTGLLFLCLLARHLIAVLVGALDLAGCVGDAVGRTDILIIVNSRLNLLNLVVLLPQILQLCLKLGLVPAESLQELIALGLVLELLAFDAEALDFFEDGVDAGLGVAEVFGVVHRGDSVVVGLAGVDDHGGLG